VVINTGTTSLYHIISFGPSFQEEVSPGAGFMKIAGIGDKNNNSDTFFLPSPF
jgi:hypothetical protein